MLRSIQGLDMNSISRQIINKLVHPVYNVPAVLLRTSSGLSFPTGVKAAWSTRSLVSGYSGNVIRVRRSSDNAESDFTATQVSNGSMLSWVGAGNGFIVTMYDQVGTAHITQATTTRQPSIVTSGTQLENPTFSGAQVLAQSTLFSPDIAQPATIMMVTSRSSNTPTDSQVHFGGVDNAKRWQIGSQGSTPQLNIFAGDFGYPRTYEKTSTWGKRVISIVLNGASTQVWTDNAWRDQGTAGTYALSGALLGGLAASNWFNGVANDVVIFDHALTADEMNAASTIIASNQSITLVPRVLQIADYNVIEASNTHYDFGSVVVNGDDNSVIVLFNRAVGHTVAGGALSQYKYNGSSWTYSVIDTPPAFQTLINLGGGKDSTGTIYFCATRLTVNPLTFHEIKVYKSTDDGATWANHAVIGKPTGQARFSAYGPLVEWPDIGSGRRLMQSAYSFELTSGSGICKPYVAFCDPDVDDTDWTELVEVDSTSVNQPTEFAAVRVSNTEAIGVARNNNGTMRQYKTTDRGQTWIYQGTIPQSIGTGQDVSPWLHEHDGLVYLIWCCRVISNKKMQLKYCYASATDLLTSNIAWSLSCSVHSCNHSTGSDFGFPVLFERNGNLKALFSDKVVSTTPDLMISDL